MISQAYFSNEILHEIKIWWKIHIAVMQLMAIRGPSQYKDVILSV